MIRSMTGYGKTQRTIEQRIYNIEIRSVNHRYLDISVKMPKQLSYLEDIVKKEISSKINRGKIDVYITLENNSANGKKVKINTEIAKLYIDELKRLAEQENIQANIEVTEISKLPDVLSIENIEDDDLIKEEITQILRETIQQLISMKHIEGEKIASDLLIRIQKINNKIKEISKISTGLINEYVVKLENRINEILKEQVVDKSRLAQEVVIYADKCSIEEEVTRLNSHIFQINTVLKDSSQPVGKKMDFIIQEMNREINTIGSKANNLEITNFVIDIKTELENIREQIQNIE